MFTCPVCNGDVITGIVYIDQLQADCLDCGAHLQQYVPDNFQLIIKGGAISGSEINEEHEKKVSKIRIEWAKQAAERAMNLLYPDLEFEIRWKDENE